MPTSDPMHISLICGKLIELKPTSVLDIGIGYGKWGLLVREYVDCWSAKRLLPSQWATKLIGIEVFRGYDNPVWSVYSGLIIADVREAIKSIILSGEKYELVLMIDVLEHLTREDGLKLLSQLKQIGRDVIFTYSNCHQEGVCSNQYENHISKWELQDFDYLDAKVLAQGEGWGLLITSH
jgi:hypothetical protein